MALQCPHCSHRTFEADIIISARVEITGLDDGEYYEEEIRSYNRDWYTLQCCRCGGECHESEARAAFEAASGDWFDDDIDDWYEGQRATWSMPAAPQLDLSHPALASCWSIACAWNFWLWQQELLHPTPHTKE